MSSSRSDVSWPGNSKSVFVSAEMEGSRYPGLSRRGPSHNSVRMLSSDSFLTSTFLLCGEFEVVGIGGGDRWPPPASSWKTGIPELVDAPLCGYTCIMEEIGMFLCKTSSGESGIAIEMSSPLVTLRFVAVIKTFTSRWYITRLYATGKEKGSTWREESQQTVKLPLQ